MMVKYPLALASALFWMGAVCAISFLEAWLKFRAPGVTMPIGLGIGRRVFSALNKVEWVLAVIAVVNLLLNSAAFGNRWQLNLIFVAVAILVAQTFWLLPALDERALMIIDGKSVPGSNLHFFFVALEALKVIALGTFSYFLIQPLKP